MIKPLIHLCLLIDLSFTASLSIVRVSTAVFPKRKPNFAHTRCSLRSDYSVFKNITKHTRRHLEKIPEKFARSTQCNVTWQTSSEYRRLTVPIGRTLNYVSFVRKIQIPEIFVSPLVVQEWPQCSLQAT